jgi:hypothetical protein
MSQSVPGLVSTFVTGADLSTHKNKFLRISADNTVNLATANGQPVIGVQDDTPHNAAGVQVAVRLSGTADIVAGAAVSAGAFVTANASGQAITCTTGQMAHGIAIQAATALGDLIEVFLTKTIAP